MAGHHYCRKRVDRWVSEHTIEEKDETKRRTEQRQFARFYRATVRGFAIGFLLRGGIHSVTALARVAKRQAPGGLWERALDTARWACAMGCFGGVYVGVDEALRSFVGCHRSSSYRAAVAGALAGPAVLLTGIRARHDEAALYLLLRGITLLVRVGNKETAPSPIRQALAVTRWQHGDTALMCIACWQILNCYLLTPNDLPPSFIRFLDKMAGFAPWFIPLAREMCVRNAMGIPKTDPIPMVQNTPLAGKTGLTMCDVLHPERNGAGACDTHFLEVFPELFRRSIGVYLPVYAASTVAVQRASVLKKPLHFLGKMLGGALRSSAFLTVYVAAAHRAVCLANTFGGGRQGLTPLRFQMVAWLPGLATILEKKTRRMELALYCICRAILSFYASMLRHKATPRWLARCRTDIIALALAAAAVMHCYSGAYGEHRDIFRSKYLNVLDFIFGSDGVSQGVIKHAEGNREIVTRAGRAVHNAAKETMRSISSHNLLAGLATS